jgi:hypothetical protein
MFPSDWGVMTVLVIAEGYQVGRERIVVDEPNGKNRTTITLKQ